MAITLQKAQTINGTRYDAFTVVTGLSAADEQRLLQGGDALPVDLGGAVSGAGIQNSAAHIGDSRTAHLLTGGLSEQTALSSRHWWNHYNALAGQPMPLAGVFAESGRRTDEYINTYLQQALASGCQWLIFGFPCVNDISQAAAGYTNSDGVAVTLANVVAVAAAKLQAAMLTAKAAGKRVISLSEPGASNFTQAQVTCVFEFNARMRAWCAANGIEYFDVTPTLWAPTSSATAIAFRSGYTSNDAGAADPTHFSTRGAYYLGKAFQSFFAGRVSAPDFLTASIADVYATNPLSLYINPLFNTATGGTDAAAGGTINNLANLPSGNRAVVRAGVTCTITQAANADGFGNDVTLAFTTTAAALCQIDQSIPIGNWSLSDYIQAGYEVSVAAGSVNASVYQALSIATDAGTPNSFCLYSAASGFGTYYGPGPTEAYTYKLLTPPTRAKAGSTSKTFVSAPLMVALAGNGSAITLTLRRGLLRKVLVP